MLAKAKNHSKLSISYIFIIELLIISLLVGFWCGYNSIDMAENERPTGNYSGINTASIT